MSRVFSYAFSLILVVIAPFVAVRLLREDVELANGSRLSFDTKGEGVAVILVDDYAIDWGPIPRLVQNEGMKVVSYDRSGFGDSTLGAGRSACNLEVDADELDGLLDRLSLVDVLIVGRRYGALVATATAIKYPERVSALILVDVPKPKNAASAEAVQPKNSSAQASVIIEWAHGIAVVTNWLSGGRLMGRSGYDIGKFLTHPTVANPLNIDCLEVFDADKSYLSRKKTDVHTTVLLDTDDAYIDAFEFENTVGVIFRDLRLYVSGSAVSRASASAAMEIVRLVAETKIRLE